MLRYRKNFRYRGRSYQAQFIKRPFREGLEVSVRLGNGERLRIGELGLGEHALLERICGEIDRIEHTLDAGAGCAKI